MTGAVGLASTDDLIRGDVILVRVTTRAKSSYREFTPPRALAPYLECVWVQTVAGGDEIYDQPVFPDGRIDIVSVGNDIMLAGPATHPLIVRLTPGTLTVGLRFRPGAAPALVATSAADLRDRDVGLEELWGHKGAQIAAQCAETQRPEARLRTLAAALQSRLPDAQPVDPVGSRVASLLTQHPGRSVSALAADIGLSERQLRRRVEHTVGYSPRTLARILRFRRFLQAARATGPGRHLAQLAIEAGYADQAHLTRESRELGGLPPMALLEWEAQRLCG